MGNNDWKARLGMVYSTDPDFAYRTDERDEPATLPPAQQDLRVWLDRKHRGAKLPPKEGQNIIQGDHRDRIVEILLETGYRCKRAGS